MKFEWDIKKDKSNIKKHGISFNTATNVFLDPNRLEYFDSIHSTDEERYIVIGMVYEVLLVVYTLRKKKIRLISARLATREECNFYYEENG